jgi:hypothetical protein
VGPAVRAAFRRKGYPSEPARGPSTCSTRLRRQRDDAALRSGRDDLRVGCREPVRAARRRAPRRRRGRGALGRPSSRRAAEGVGRLRSRRPAGRARAGCSSTSTARASTATRSGRGPSRSWPSSWPKG